jgi:hypothetical protein
MSNFMMNVVSWILLLLVILTLYLIDKVNHLSRLYEKPAEDANKEPEFPDVDMAPPGDLLFAGLEGKKLWDAMSGKQVDGFDETLIDSLRPHYEQILRDHIAATFHDGVEDAAEEGRMPNSQRPITTPRGHVESWLPPQHLGSIYRAATEYATVYRNAPDPAVLHRLKETVDGVVDMLYQRVALTNEAPMADDLLQALPQPALPMPEGMEDALLAMDHVDAPNLEVLEDSAHPTQTPEQALAEGLAQVQAYEDQQRQEFAAETVEPLTEEATQAPAPEVLEPVMASAQTQPMSA